MPPNFFLGMKAIPGAIEGITRLLEEGHNIRVCTSQLTKNPYCLQEKYDWLQHHAPSLIRRLIITKDKTLVRGDILIDDKPRITGSLVPTWQHVIFDQPYNRHVEGPRMSWDKIDEFLAYLATFPAS